MNDTASTASTPTPLDTFQQAVIGIHAQFANTLAQAGNPVSEANTASELLNVAAAASATIGKTPPAGAPPAAPNYADFALHAFMVSMEHAAVAFAAAHLPDKYKPVMDALSEDVRVALGGGQAVDAAIDAAGVAVDIAHPEATPIIGIAEPIVEHAVDEALGLGAQAAAPAAAPITETAAGEPVALASKADLLADDAQH